MLKLGHVVEVEFILMGGTFMSLPADCRPISSGTSMTRSAVRRRPPALLPIQPTTDMRCCCNNMQEPAGQPAAAADASAACSAACWVHAAAAGWQSCIMGVSAGAAAPGGAW